ncbi:MAG: DNA-directed RNA polymerase subunit omega [Thermoanaerobaculales bacterium]
MIQLPEGFDSIFRYIVVVSQRAEQLINGAKVRSESRFLKPTLQARSDVDQARVEWRVLTQEELDAHRQALVEQFRAEVDAAGDGRPAPPIPDVLPTAASESPAPAVEPKEEERDDELARLQRLLGMVREPDATGKTGVDADAEQDAPVDAGEKATAEAADEETSA